MVGALGKQARGAVFAADRRELVVGEDGPGHVVRLLCAGRWTRPGGAHGATREAGALAARPPGRDGSAPRGGRSVHCGARPRSWARAHPPSTEGGSPVPSGQLEPRSACSGRCCAARPCAASWARSCCSRPSSSAPGSRCSCTRTTRWARERRRGGRHPARAVGAVRGRRDVRRGPVRPRSTCCCSGTRFQAVAMGITGAGMLLGWPPAGGDRRRGGGGLLAHPDPARPLGAAADARPHARGAHDGERRRGLRRGHRADGRSARRPRLVLAFGPPGAVFAAGGRDALVAAAPRRRACRSTAVARSRTRTPPGDPGRGHPAPDAGRPSTRTSTRAPGPPQGRGCGRWAGAATRG